MGSSPLARGRLFPIAIWSFSSGLIPAGAGQTSPGGGPVIVCPAHPRWRGADSTPGKCREGVAGSSPLARGRPSAPRQRWIRAGLIPAGAGQTHRGHHRSAGGAAHPRWRGADLLSGVDISQGQGSSPLARGRPSCARVPISRARLIPAGAGQTDSRVFRFTPVTAHPRWRGADGAAAPARDYAHGSSPLARGRPEVLLRSEHCDRLIPAGAGQTTTPMSSSRSAPAHPRWRGADFARCWTPGSSRGSSPLARGRPRAASPAHGHGGLIPAGAGQTRAPTRSCSPLAAHPRWRGADCSFSHSQPADNGSSPLARGRPRPGPQPRTRMGLIPAGAGQTSDAAPGHNRRRAHPRWRGADSSRSINSPS